MADRHPFCYEGDFARVSLLLLRIHRHASRETIHRFKIYRYKTISLSFRSLLIMPARYPKISTNKNNRLFPWVDLDLMERAMENGQAAPKQSSMMASKTLNSGIPL